MRLIDAHIHVTRDGQWYGTGLDASEGRALREMDAAGVEMAALVPVADMDNRAFCLELAAARPDRFFTGFTVLSLDDAELRRFEALVQEGRVRFLKIHPRSTGIAPLAEGLAPFLHLAEGRGIPAVFCSYMRGLSLPLSELQPLIFDTLARRHPGLSIVLAHAGSYRPMDALAVAQTHPNVWIEMSHVLDYFRGSSLENDFAFILRRLDRKVIFGSDFPEVSIGAYAERARTLLGAEALARADGFFGRHARKLFGLGEGV